MSYVPVWMRASLLNAGVEKSETAILATAKAISEATLFSFDEAFDIVLRAVQDKPRYRSIAEALDHVLLMYNASPSLTSGGFVTSTKLGALNANEYIIPWKAEPTMNKLGKVIELVEQHTQLKAQIKKLDSTGLDDIGISIYFHKEDDAMTVEDKAAVIDLVTLNLKQQLNKIDHTLDAINVALNMVTGL